MIATRLGGGYVLSMNRRFPLRALLLAACLTTGLALAGCSGDDLSRQIGITRDVPDEFQVTTRAPLSMPPDFTLRPPSPGAPRPQELTASQSAEATLVPQAALGAADSPQPDAQPPGGQASEGQALASPAAGGVSPGGTSPGQQALLGALGKPAPADIREKLQHDAAVDSPGPGLTDELMFWRKPPPPGVVVDPQKEQQRLRENAALGRSVETGDTPIIQRTQQSGGLLDGIF